MKKSKKQCKVVYETHYRELRTGMNNKPLKNPFLSESEKSIAPYEDPSSDETELFESGEISTFKRIGVLNRLLHKLKVLYKYDLEYEEFEVQLIDEKHIKPLPYYLYVNSEGKYSFALFTTEYEEKFSGNISEMKNFLSSKPFVKRKSIA